jgi:hypothetical protein
LLEIPEEQQVDEQAKNQLSPYEAHLRSTSSGELEEGVLYLQPDCRDRPPSDNKADDTTFARMTPADRKIWLRTWLRKHHA